MFLLRIFFLLSTSIYVYSQDDNSASDILFLKIQELEIEIAELRNQVESQNHLIEKLLQESSKESDKGSNIIKDISADNAIRFKGVSDIKSKEDVYSAATKYLENQNYDDAFKLFKFFTETFVDEQKTPLAFFWLGEISFINNDIEKSKGYFLDLVSSYPDHYRVPLAHKKIGDIYLKNNDVEMAIDRYNYVIREYPNNAASSQALQLLKNME
jgi:tol-pal system protein YbgF